MGDTTYDVTNNEKEMQFEIEVDGEKSYLSYRYYKKKIAFMHTSVPEVLEGKGIASALAKEAFSFALTQNMPVIVYCPFVAGFIKKHPEYKKQLDPEYNR
jgi:uncharacterized protein